MREPLPLYCLTSAAYAEAVAIGRDPVTAARAAWTSEWNFEAEDQELEHQLVLGGVRPFDELPAGELGERRPAVGGSARPRGRERPMTGVAGAAGARARRCGGAAC